MRAVRSRRATCHGQTGPSPALWPPSARGPGAAAGGRAAAGSRAGAAPPGSAAARREMTASDADAGRTVSEEPPSNQRDEAERRHPQHAQHEIESRKPSGIRVINQVLTSDRLIYDLMTGADR